MLQNEIIKNYRLLSKLGEGGMGEVWLAEHLTIKRRVAIKVLHPQYLRNEQVRSRFRTEAVTLARLKHPNIVSLYDFVETEDQICLVMEYVEGRNIEDLVRQETGPLPVLKLEAIFSQILRAVGYAHEQGVIHRDIKPSNFMVTLDGSVKVLDFGIAKLLSDDHHLTKTGIRMGTASYMSPEQVNAEELDLRSDIYSLGVTLFFLATGKSPYEGETSEYKIYDQIVRSPLPSGKSVYVGVTEHLDQVIAIATEKAPSARFLNCREFLEALLDKDHFKVSQTVPKGAKRGERKSRSGDQSISATAKSVPTRKRGYWKPLITFAVIGLVVYSVMYNLLNKPTGTNQVDFDYTEGGQTASEHEPNRMENSIPPEIEANTVPQENKTTNRPAENEAVSLDRLQTADSDQDGLDDATDHCPNAAGLAANKGCPDSDGDGLNDEEDECATYFGPKSNRGCPYGDFDNDGVTDEVDQCPRDAGPKSNNGCPTLSKSTTTYKPSNENQPITSGPTPFKCPASLTFNGDRQHDLFIVDYKGREPYRIQIYTYAGKANGTKLFESYSTANSWNGNDLNGNLVKRDIYKWYITIGWKEYMGDFYFDPSALPNNESRPIIGEQPPFKCPSSLTLNGNKWHDQFIVDYKGSERYRIQIYTYAGKANGIKLFESNSTTISWNGNDLNGNPVKRDIYKWYITIGTKEYVGDFYLDRP